MNCKTLAEVRKKIDSLEFKENFDIIVAVSRGGINPAKLLSEKLNLDIEIIKINYRDDDHKIIYDKPNLLDDVSFEFKNKKILLVDDVVKTGHTIEVAKEELLGCKIIKTFAVNGLADYSLYNEDCFKVNWPN